jgi:hypothetical protein
LSAVEGPASERREAGSDAVVVVHDMIADLEVAQRGEKRTEAPAVAFAAARERPCQELRLAVDRDPRGGQAIAPLDLPADDLDAAVPERDLAPFEELGERGMALRRRHQQQPLATRPRRLHFVRKAR